VSEREGDAVAVDQVPNEDITERLMRVVSLLSDVDRDDASAEELRGAVREVLAELDFLRRY
jgi:hypothetical protein